ncbi:uncharacterized protein LOC144104344 isoform X3 [Amblyomma americanum]
MRKEVMYRDLPGGPLQLNFTDELPLCMFCSKCGMLSKNMFEDPKCHAFCSVCIFESSDRKKIHCKYENKEVSVDEMMPAVDIITIVMDQIVYCPNKGGDNSCERYFSLKDLEEHYLECEETKISCLTCGDDVKGKEWGDHAKNCPQQILQCRYCVVAVPRWKLEDHERVCNENPSAIRGGSEVLKCPGDSPSALMVPSQNYAQRSVQENKSQRFKAPDTKSPDVMNTNDGNKTTICIVCNRKVKNKNMNMHLDVCIRNSSATPVNSTWKDEHTSETTKTTDLVPKLGPAQVPPVGTHEEAEKFNSFSPSKPSTFHGETQTPALVSPTTIYPRLQSGVAEESASAYWPQQSENTGGLHDYCQTPALVSPTTICPRLQSGVAEESASAYWPQQSENTGGLHDYCQTTPQDYAIPVITNYVSESAQEDPSVYQPGESDRQRDDVEMDSDPLGDSVNSSFEVIYKAEARDDSHSHEQHPTTPAFQDGNRDRGAASPVVVSQPSSAGPATMASEEPSEATGALDEEISVSITEASPGLFQDLDHKIINGVDVQLTWETPEDLINLHSYIVECKDADTGRQVSQLIEGGRLLTQVTVPLETPLATFDCNLLAVSTETGKAVNGSSAKFTVSTGNIDPPIHVTLSGRTSTSLTYTWTANTTPSMWKVVTKRTDQLDGNGTHKEEYGEGEELNVKHTVTQLEPATEYNISIQNCRGIFCSRPIFVTGVTDVSPPGPVQSLSYKLINGTILEVAWDAPESSKRVDGFFVTCESISSCIDVSKQVESVGPSSMVLLSLEEPKEIFECAVLAFCTDSAGRHLNGTVTKFEVSTEGLYAPEKLRLLERSDKSISLAWAPDVNTTVWKMSAWRVLPSGDEHDSIQEHGESSGKIVKYTLTDLKPWTRYNVSVQNCLENFCSEPAVLLASTDAAAPSRVENFAVLVESDVNAHFTWERPDQPNGPIDGYHLLVYNEDKKENTSFTVPGNSTEIRMHFAHEFNRFHASITAYNVAESSNETVYSPVSEVEFQTFGNGPMPPRVEVTDIKDRSVHLSWKQPSDPRYLIVKFIVKVNGSDATAKPVRVNESGTTSTPAYHLSMRDLEVWKHYYVTVASCINDTTCGQDTTVEFNTEFEAPSIPLNLTIGALSSDWMLVQWEKPLISNGPLSGYNLSISDGVTRFHVTTTHLSYNYTEVVPGTSYDVTVYAFNDVDGVVKCGAVASVVVSSLESNRTREKSCSSKTSLSHVACLWTTSKSYI